MPHYFKEEYETEPLGEDKTPISKYSIELSERDVDALQHLKSRNGAGIESVPVENIALWKMINQVCESPQKSIWLKVSEIEHPEWLV